MRTSVGRAFRLRVKLRRTAEALAKAVRPGALVLTLLLSACVDKMLEQDLRITNTPPAAKLSADILWKEYQDDAKKADKDYWGKAILVTGVATTVPKDGPAPHVIIFGQGPQSSVRAQLLDEQAAEILASVQPGERIALKCFCAGLQGDVQLKSCIKP